MRRSTWTDCVLHWTLKRHVICCSCCNDQWVIFINQFDRLETISQLGFLLWLSPRQQKLTLTLVLIRLLYETAWLQVQTTSTSFQKSQKKKKRMPPARFELATFMSWILVSYCCRFWLETGCDAQTVGVDSSLAWLSRWRGIIHITCYHYTTGAYWFIIQELQYINTWTMANTGVGRQMWSKIWERGRGCGEMLDTCTSRF